MSTECIDAKAMAAERPASQSGTLDSSVLKVRAQNKGYMYIAPALHVDDDGFGHANTFRCNTVGRIARCSWTHTCSTRDCHVLEIGCVPLLLNAERRGQRPSGTVTAHARTPPRSLGIPTVAARIQMTSKVSTLTYLIVACKAHHHRTNLNDTTVLSAFTVHLVGRR